MIKAITFMAPQTCLTLRCDALSTDETGQIFLLSVAGSSSAIKAVSALFHSKSRTRFELGDLPDPFTYQRRARFHPAGYRIRKAKLDKHTWHLLALANAAGFMPVVSHASLWDALHQEGYTTPLLRSWLAWLQRQFECEGCLKALDRFGCKAGLFQLKPEDLDRLVTHGLTTGQLEIIDAQGNQQPGRIPDSLRRTPVPAGGSNSQPLARPEARPTSKPGPVASAL